MSSRLTAVLPLAAVSVLASIGAAHGSVGIRGVEHFGGSAALPRYRLVDLTRLVPHGYSTPVPVGINRSGEVVGEVYTGTASPPRLTDPAVWRPPTAARGDAPGKPKAHVFVYQGGRFQLLQTPPHTTEAWVVGLDDQGRFTVSTCMTSDCNHYFVVSPQKGGFAWTSLPGADLGTAGLGPIAANGDVAGAISVGSSQFAVIWHRSRTGSYGKPQPLGREPHPGHFIRRYLADAIVSTPAGDIAGGAEISPAFYPDETAVLWGPKLAHDFGFIGSHTMAMANAGSGTLAVVGCEQPVPACGPACPIDPVVYKVAVSGGLPSVSGKITLGQPPAGHAHCGLSPSGVTADKAGRPLTVGATALLSGRSYVAAAAVWLGARFVFLSDLTRVPTGTSLTWATAVNSAGVIVGTSDLGGRSGAFLALPLGGW